MVKARGEDKIDFRFIHKIKSSRISDNVFVVFCLQFSFFFKIFVSLFVALVIFFSSLEYLRIMKGTQGRNSSAVDVRIACVGSGVNFDIGYGGRPRRVLSGERNALVVEPRWEYCDYVEWCVG